jgi:hypothetical protein
MFHTAPSKRSLVVVFLSTLSTVVVISTFASAQQELFFEETAGAFWQLPHKCADGTIAQATLLVQSTRDFDAPDRDDPDPTARVQFLAVCSDGTSFSWAAPTAPAVITSTENLKSVTAKGSGTARDNLGGTHQVTFNVAWTGDGPLLVNINNPGSMRKQRDGSATGQVTFDGKVIVNGAANHPTRPRPFIRVDTER